MREAYLYCSLSMALATCLVAQPAFFRQDIPVGTAPSAVAAGDFNGDGWTDLVVATSEGLLALLNAGGAEFEDSMRTESASAGRLVVADFNGDGKDDLVAGRAVLLSIGDGAFRRSQEGLGPVLAAADLNGDNRSDLLTIIGRDPNDGPPYWVAVAVWLGHGDGTFERGPSVTTDEPKWGYGAAVADFNRDGRLDVMLQDYGELLVFPGRGDGTFHPPVKPSEGSWTLLTVADFNGDDIPDVATEDRILLGDGDGNFSRSVWYATKPDGEPIVSPAFTRWPVAVGDFTADGNADVALALEERDFILVHLGNGDGTVAAPTTQSIGWGSQSPAAVADLDQDGRADLAVVNSLSNRLTLLLSRSQGGPRLRQAVSAASGMAIVAPESLATLVAPTPATATLSAFAPWPAMLGGLSLEVRDSAGDTRLAPLVFVSPSQINFQVPTGTALGQASLFIAADGETTEAGSMQVQAIAPALFMVSHAGSVPAATAVMVEPNGAQVGIPVFLCGPAATNVDCHLSGIPLSTSGERAIYVSFFGTGFSGANRESVNCSIDGIPVPVSYAGPQGTPGLDQINVRLVPELIHGRGYGEVVTLRMNGVTSNSAGIYVK